MEGFRRDSHKYAIPKFSKCKILVGKILTIQHALVKFVRLFPP